MVSSRKGGGCSLVCDVKDVAIAMSIAQNAHYGQKDKLGNDYLEHPVRVAAPFMARGEWDLAVVALLHDVIEDCPAEYAEQIGNVFPAAIVDAVQAISRQEGETYMEYIRRCGESRLAREVKISDLRDNLSVFRIDESLRGLRQRYLKSLEYLEFHYADTWGTK